MIDEILRKAADVANHSIVGGYCVWCRTEARDCKCEMGILRAALADSVDAEETADLQKLLARIDGYKATADAPEGPSFSGAMTRLHRAVVEGNRPVEVNSWDLALILNALVDRLDAQQENEG